MYPILDVSYVRCILHNMFVCRPDVVDFRQVQSQTARANLDMAFKLFESEYGVTQLLDPEGRHSSHQNKHIYPFLLFIINGL